jgi:hypothetical protein
MKTFRVCANSEIRRVEGASFRISDGHLLVETNDDDNDVITIAAFAVGTWSSIEDEGDAE